MKSLTNCYTLHGLGITVSSASAPAVLAALHARLRQFATSGYSSLDLTFEVCCVPDSGAHVVEKPPGRARPVYQPPLGEVVYFDEQDQLYLNYGDRVRVLCDLRQGQARMSIRQPEAEHLWLASHPLFTIALVEFVKRRGLYSLHAAGLCIDKKGVLFAGTSGAGKSTLTVALLRAGCGFLGDDMLFLTLGRQGLRVLAFPDEIDVTDETIDLFPELHSLLNAAKLPGCSKRQVWAEAVYGAETVWECRPAAVIFPRVAHTDKSTLTPIDRGEALLELVPNVLLTEARSSQAHLDVLGELVRDCACYRLETGRDFAALPRLLQDL